MDSVRLLKCKEIYYCCCFVGLLARLHMVHHLLRTQYALRIVTRVAASAMTANLIDPIQSDKREVFLLGSC